MSRTNLQRLRVGALTTARTAIFVPLSGVPQRRGMDLRDYEVGPLEAFVLSMVDGGTTVEDLAAAAAISTAEMHRVLHVLAERGVIDFVEAGASRTRMRSPIDRGA